MNSTRPAPSDAPVTGADVEQRYSPRAQSTRRAVLDAAGAVFAEKGYEASSIAELVERSGISVGSIYHHFGGKAEVFGALYDEFYHRQRRRTEEGSARAREAGETDTLAIYLAGARAYLDGCWRDREQTRLFHAMEGPPGLWRARQERVTAWVRTNIDELDSASLPHGDSLAHAVTAVVLACAIELTEVDSPTAAEELIEYFLGLIARVAAP
ncbi:hypothetical protein GCM10023094_41010 [Rhodococcus olei]|uniref:HTH tetR-type domain-containing protein n=1 Tax=Rhodococcus olei TaxID=2161675 RepID=A0ABP8PFD3_9NOCA